MLGTARQDMSEERWQGVALESVVLRGGVSADT